MSQNICSVNCFAPKKKNSVPVGCKLWFGALAVPVVSAAAAVHRVHSVYTNQQRCQCYREKNRQERERDYILHKIVRERAYASEREREKGRYYKLPILERDRDREPVP